MVMGNFVPSLYYYAGWTEEITKDKQIDVMDVPNESATAKEFELCGQLCQNGFGSSNCVRFESALKVENLGKNRYGNVLPEEHSRVRLNMNEGSDYINGNYICLPGESNEKYIACQAPLPNTFVDFYSAVWENKSPVICMVTKQIEGCTQKAHCYWPSLEGETIQIDDFFITVETFEDLSNIEVRTLTIQFQEEKKNSCSFALYRMAGFWCS